MEFRFKVAQLTEICNSVTEGIKRLRIKGVDVVTKLLARSWSSNPVPSFRMWRLFVTSPRLGLLCHSTVEREFTRSTRSLALHRTAGPK